MAINVGYPSRDSSVGRAEDCSVLFAILRSLVRIRLAGVSFFTLYLSNKKVQVGKDQKKAQSEKDSHSKNRGGKKPN